MVSRRARGIQELLRVTVGIVISFFLAVLPSAAQSTAARIALPIDESRLVRLAGNTHPLARPESDHGAAADTQHLKRMLLLLGRSPEQETSLRKLLDDQQSPGSPNYHRWLTPEQFGEQFGPAQGDIQIVTNWLAGHGFEVVRVSNGRTVIEFNGTAGQLLQAFHSQIHQYVVDGQQYWANASDPQVPVALAPVVKGFASLNNFPRQYYSHYAGNFRRDVKSGKVTPYLTTSNGFFGLAPADFATIYNSLPLLSSGNDGTGQTIAIVGETAIDPSNLSNFRSAFGLGAGNTQVILDGPDPGITSLDEELEADLDTQWSSAVAPGATLKFVTSASTEVTQGIDLSALYIIENNLAGVMSESYGSCEARLGAGGNLFYQSLWEQASAQGITAIVSSGDSAAAGCDAQGETEAVNGLGVNGIGSTPFNIALGGTDYNDAGNFSTYWTSTNGEVTAGTYSLPYLSALSYIPEMTWNDSCADTAQAGSLAVCVGQPAGVFGGSVVRGGGGGRSSCTGSSCTGYPKPSWQIPLTPNDGVRDVPDVSFFAAGGESSSQSFYVVCQTDILPPGVSACVPGSNNSISFSGVGGTSASAPSFAGMVALAMQKAGSRLGNLNYLLYPVAQSSPSSFHDITVGNISTPCAPGSPNCSSPNSTGVLIDSNSDPAYAAGTGYDMATGLGTPNIANLVDAVAAAANGRFSTTTTLTLNGGTATINAAHGMPITVTINVNNASGMGNGPAGDVAVMSSTGIAVDGTSPGHTLVSGSAGQSSVSWSSSLFPGGTYNAFANYGGDGANAASQSGNIAINISSETSRVFAILEECNSNQITAILIGSANLSYGSCYFMRYDVGDSAATFLGMVSPVVSSKCTNGIASCPTGSVTITDNGATLDGGVFQLNPYATSEDRRVQLTGGTHTIVASYPGDSSYKSNSGSITVTVNPVNTSISQPTSTPSTPTVNQSVQLVANVTTATNGAPPTGTVTFYDNGTAMTGTLTMTGNPASGNAGSSTLAVLTTTFRTTGAHIVKAQYNGDVNYNASALSAGLSVNVTTGSPVSSAITTPAASATPALAGVAVTLTTTIAPASGSGGVLAPSGAVSFLDGTSTLPGTVNYSTSGTTLTATLSYAFTTTGSHSVTAQYSGDSNYRPSTSSALSLTVNLPYSVSLDQSAITKTGGGSGTVTLTLSPATGFSGQVDVSCTSSSAQATCTPTSSAPSTVTVNSGSNATASIAFAVPALTAAAGSRYAARWTLAIGMLLFSFCLVPIRRQPKHRGWIVSLVMLAALLSVTSCGGGSHNSSSNPVTYTFAVKSVLHSNSNVSSTTQFTVTVN